MSFSFSMKNPYIFAVICALTATLFLGAKTPVNKLFLSGTDPIMTAVLTNIGAAVGMFLVMLLGKNTGLVDKNRHAGKSDIPNIIGMILTSVGGSLLFFFGLAVSTASNASLMNNFCAVATAIVAFFIFREKIPKRLCIGIVFTVLGCIALSVTDLSSLEFSTGSLLILASCVCYAFNNNFMKRLSHKNPTEIVAIRAAGVACCCVAAAVIYGSSLPSLAVIGGLLISGFVFAGGINLFLMYAQRQLGAAKASAITSVSPLVAVLISFIFLGEPLSILFAGALVLVLPGMYFTLTRNKEAIPEEEPADSPESPLLTDMSDAAKNEARNYVMAFGFIALAVCAIVTLFEMMLDSPEIYYSFLSDDNGRFIVSVAIGLLLIFCAIALLVLRRRVLPAITFLYFGALYIVYWVSGGCLPVVTAVTVFSLLFALILLTAGDKQKYVYSLIVILNSLIFVSISFTQNELFNTIFRVILVLSVLALLYLALASASQKVAFPLQKYLTANSTVSFNKCGAILGFLFFGAYLLIWIIDEFSEQLISTDVEVKTTIVFSLMLLLVGILLFVIAKRSFNSLIFISIGFVTLLECLYSSSSMIMLYSLLFLIVGVFAVFRSSSALLFALLMIGQAFSEVLRSMLDVFPELFNTAILLDVFCILVCIYLAFAVFSEKPKLPVF
ncbi:MAG TPA: DMT family transporter [Methanocorpusculum sp.]|nr:DMT family transporter [Methanocorpusculum sp.]